jgi:hypothetical protein
VKRILIRGIFFGMIAQILKMQVFSSGLLDPANTD